MLNGQQSRIAPLVPLMWKHCGYAYETVEHHLLHCVTLRYLRYSLLLPHPTLENCLYNNTTHRKKYNCIGRRIGLKVQKRGSLQTQTVFPEYHRLWRIWHLRSNWGVVPCLWKHSESLEICCYCLYHNSEEQVANLFPSVFCASQRRWILKEF